MVVYCHVPLLAGTKADNYTQLITYMAVPIFFMVNGAALFQGKLNYEKHWKKILHLFLVTRVWRLIYLLFSAAFHYVELPAVPKLNFLTYFLGASISGVPSGPLWFIRALIGCYLIFPVLKIAFDSKEGRRCLWILCAVGTALMLVKQDALFLQEIFTSQGKLPAGEAVSLGFLDKYNPFGGWEILYFLLGGLLHQKFYENRQYSTGKILGAGAVWFAASLGFFCIKGFISGFSGTALNNFTIYGVNGAYQSVAVLFMAGSVFLGAMNLPFRSERRNKIWKLVGRNTLAIYYTHYMGGYLLKDHVAFFQTNWGVEMNLLKTVILVCAGLILGWIIKKIPYARKLVA